MKPHSAQIHLSIMGRSFRSLACLALVSRQGPTGSPLAAFVPSQAKTAAKGRLWISSGLREHDLRVRPAPWRAVLRRRRAIRGQRARLAGNVTALAGFQIHNRRKAPNRVVERQWKSGRRGIEQVAVILRQEIAVALQSSAVRVMRPFFLSPRSRSPIVDRRPPVVFMISLGPMGRSFKSART